ncbi:MAG: metal-sensing transcriptional repressor [Coleofasciculaceae cyanobacterium SM2_1_6]|nr:metal-sensing transcriptional repressor [Coleofasciculaceae cyanobacterium SM2_1_6]
MPKNSSRPQPSTDTPTNHHNHHHLDHHLDLTALTGDDLLSADDSADDSPEPHPHVHSPRSVKAVINRLSRIEGHIRAVKTMVQEDRECPQVLIQIAAVRGALDRVARMILDEHLTACVARAAQEGNIEEEIQELKAALDRFLP